MELKLVVAGIGGQGVIYTARVLSQAALARHECVIVSENHGMSQRGGSVLAHVKIGGSELPLIRHATADVLIALEHNEALRNLTFARSGGSVFINSHQPLKPIVLKRLAELKIDVYMLDADAGVREFGTGVVMNLIMLGFAAAHTDWHFTVNDLEDAVRAIGPVRAVDLNLRALARGYASSNLLNAIPHGTV